MYKGNHDNHGNSEHRIALGVVYEDGSWFAWAEGMRLINNHTFGDRWALIAGLAYDFGVADIAFEVQWLEKRHTDLTAGMNIIVTRGVRLGPQVSYRICSDSAHRCRDRWRIGSRVHIGTDNDIYNRRSRSLSGQEYDELGEL